MFFGAVALDAVGDEERADVGLEMIERGGVGRGEGGEICKYICDRVVHGMRPVGWLVRQLAGLLNMLRWGGCKNVVFRFALKTA